MYHRLYSGGPNDNSSSFAFGKGTEFTDLSFNMLTFKASTWKTAEIVTIGHVKNVAHNMIII